MTDEKRDPRISTAGVGQAGAMISGFRGVSANGEAGVIRGAGNAADAGVYVITDATGAIERIEVHDGHEPLAAETPLPPFALDTQGAGLDQGAFDPSVFQGNAFDTAAGVAAMRRRSLQADTGNYAIDFGSVGPSPPASAALTDSSYVIGGWHGDIAALWANLRAQQALLEAALQARPDQPIGLGHNHGPSFLSTPNEDLAATNRLIALLSDDGPRDRAQATELLTAAQDASTIAANGKTAISAFALAVVAGAGKKIGERAVDALAETTWWTAFYAHLADFASAVISWSQALLSM